MASQLKKFNPDSDSFSAYVEHMNIFLTDNDIKEEKSSGVSRCCIKRGWLGQTVATGSNLKWTVSVHHDRLVLWPYHSLDGGSNTAKTRSESADISPASAPNKQSLKPHPCALSHKGSIYITKSVSHRARMAWWLSVRQKPRRKR